LKLIMSTESGVVPASVFSIPMRDWNKFVDDDDFRAAFGVFSIPMRDWNSLPVCATPLRCRPFSAYLWGIETCPPSWCINVLICFQHTYEGLKRNLPGNAKRNGLLFSAYLWGIETLDGGTSLNITKRSFQHTYEGLKLRITTASMWPCLVFSAYLWGIETVEGGDS